MHLPVGPLRFRRGIRVQGMELVEAVEGARQCVAEGEVHQRLRLRLSEPAPGGRVARQQRAQGGGVEGGRRREDVGGGGVAGGGEAAARRSAREVEGQRADAAVLPVYQRRLRGLEVEQHIVRVRVPVQQPTRQRGVGKHRPSRAQPAGGKRPRDEAGRLVGPPHRANVRLERRLAAHVPLNVVRPRRANVGQAVGRGDGVSGGERAADGAKHGWRVRLAGAEQPVPRLSA
mmetsp:Transcript_46997/g.147764  ORF Transcript_46997/g.147764 Transcript_46997/m.147764 type:complete len:231 (-) Transcript_46997:400-1092(-)